ncbi:5067_t:CDS:2 [Entrophospora sp. SA101]|nr:5067_t:CDS:2 [Entrophospora sp. SA101]
MTMVMIGWIEAMGKLRDNTIPDSEKPELYKSTENAWGSKSGPVWGQRAHLMANGKDFFNELRKSSSTIVVQQQQSLLQQQPSNNVQSTNRPSTPSSPTSLSSSTSSLSLTTLSSSTVTTTAATNTTAPSSPTTPTTPKERNIIPETVKVVVFHQVSQRKIIWTSNIIYNILWFINV